MEGVQLEQPNDAEAQIHDAFESHGDPEFAEAAMHDAPEQQLLYEQPSVFEDNDSSTLFVPERGSLSPDMSRRPGPSANAQVPIAPPASRPKIAGNSVFARIRNLQKVAQDKKLAASRQSQTYPTNSNPDNEAYIEAVLQKPSSLSNVPAIDEDQVADKQAAREFEKKRRHYADLKKNGPGGQLSFRHSVEWIKIKGAEEARKKKRERDVTKAREEEEGEPNLFPETYRAPVNEEEEESDDSTFDFEEPGSLKRRRPMPKKSGKQMSMQEAELQSMQVALEADGDLPKKKKKKRKGAVVSDESEAAVSSGKDKGKAKATNRFQGQPKRRRKLNTPSSKQHHRSTPTSSGNRLVQMQPNSLRLGLGLRPMP
jgi:hypothetical protein